LRLPVSVEPKPDAREDASAEPTWTRMAMSLILITTLVAGILALGNYFDRPKHHPEFYGDYRGGYARGLELRATGHSFHDCEAGLREPYASPTTWPAIQAKGVYNVGCWRGAKGKPLGDYVRRVDYLINND
jgi:hypothetical protein